MQCTGMAEFIYRSNTAVYSSDIKMKFCNQSAANSFVHDDKDNSDEKDDDTDDDVDDNVDDDVDGDADYVECIQ